MEEIYSETYLKAVPPMKRRILRIGLIVLSAFILALGLLFSIIMGTVLAFFVMAIVVAIILFLLPTTKIAYEYIFVDGQIDFDRILKGEKRKTMKRVDMEKIDLVAPETSPTLASYKNMPLIDYSSGLASDTHYIAIAIGEKGTERIRFTPDEKMLHMMRMKSPSKIMNA